MTQNRIISGMQPTGSGELHLGNYLGAAKNWSNMQEECEAFYFVADLHAITVPYDYKNMQESIENTIINFIACGVDPEKSSIFVQSHIPQHAEFCWILSSITSIGKMNTMTQFKDKAGKNKEKSSLGLYSYPVLMAADILLYKATHVPVGDDQAQHLELTRDIASKFNNVYDTDYLILPERKTLEKTARIMSLKDGTKKMSKSHESDYSRINLTDSNEAIIDKIKKSKTSSEPEITEDMANNNPEIKNLLCIYHAVGGKIRNEDFIGKGFAYLKSALSDALISHLSPIREKISDLQKNKDHVWKIAKDGQEKARCIAEDSIKEIRKIIGLL